MRTALAYRLAVTVSIFPPPEEPNELIDLLFRQDVLEFSGLTPADSVFDPHVDSYPHCQYQTRMNLLFQQAG